MAIGACTSKSESGIAFQPIFDNARVCLTLRNLSAAGRVYKVQMCINQVPMIQSLAGAGASPVVRGASAATKIAAATITIAATAIKNVQVSLPSSDGKVPVKPFLDTELHQPIQHSATALAMQCSSMYAAGHPLTTMSQQSTGQVLKPTCR